MCRASARARRCQFVSAAFGTSVDGRLAEVAADRWRCRWCEKLWRRWVEVAGEVFGLRVSLLFGRRKRKGEEEVEGGGGALEVLEAEEILEALRVEILEEELTGDVGERRASLL